MGISHHVDLESFRSEQMRGRTTGLDRTIGKVQAVFICDVGIADQRRNDINIT